MQAILAGPEAPPADDGDRHGQDGRRLPDLLEALERPLEPHRASTAGPKILFLADRNILVDDPKDKTSRRSATPASRSRTAKSIKSREMYFAIYQALAEDERRAGPVQGISRRTSST